MAALLHAGIHQPPPNKAAFPTGKVSGTVPAKPASHADPSMAHRKPPFQSLLDHASQIGKPAEPASAIKVKNPKPTEVPAEKPKEAKKSESKDHKPDFDPALMAAILTPPKAETVAKTPKPDHESLSVTDKTKAKPERKPADSGTLVAWNPGSLETRSNQGTGAPAKGDRTEEKAKVFVVDRRSEKEKEKLKLPGAEAAAQQPVNAAVELQNQAKATDPKAASNDVQVAFQAVGGKPREGFDLKPQNTPVSPRDAASFQQYLVERGYGQMVDQARIILKDQNAGEIRMTLYPETLGKVKVSLNLNDNSLAGQIFVENQTVKDVFQSNMDGLMQAFRDGGWSDLSLQVSVGNGNGGNQAGGGQPQPGFQARDYGHQVTQTVTDGRTDRIGSWNGQVNLTA